MKFIIITVLSLCFLKVEAIQKDPIYFITSSSDEEYLNSKNLSWNFVQACEPYYNVLNLQPDPAHERDVIQAMVENKRNFIYYKPIRRNSEYTFCKSIKNAEFTELTQVTQLEPGKPSFLLGIVISNSIKNINKGDLYKYVYSIWYKKDSKENKLGSRNNCLGYTEKNNNLKTILICTKQDSDGNICKKKIKDLTKGVDVDIKFSTKCGNDVEVYENNLFAVLADSPFDVDEEIAVPVIFYNYPYVKQEIKLMIPNSLNLVVPWWLLKYGFLDVLKEMGWSRVAVLSDDSAYSIEFKEMLVDMFKKENISYTTRGCDEREYCNEKTINEALNSLEKVNARIVIANIEEKYKHMLVNRPHSFTWLTRGWSFTKKQQDDQGRPSMSLKLGPDFTNNAHNAEVNYECRGIFEGLKQILRVKKKLVFYASNNKIKRSRYFRKFINLFNKSVETLRATLFLKVVNGHQGKDEITFNTINEKSHGVIIPSFPTTLDRPSCVFKRNNYEDPCEQTATILNFMLVVIMFFIILLLITCYFHESPPSTYESID